MGHKKRQLTEGFIDISYINNNDGECISTTPELIDWYITKFDNYKMDIFLNMTNPVYVSSGDIKDVLSVRVLNPFFF